MIQTYNDFCNKQINESLSNGTHLMIHNGWVTIEKYDYDTGIDTNVQESEYSIMDVIDKKKNDFTNIDDLLQFAIDSTQINMSKKTKVSDWGINDGNDTKYVVTDILVKSVGDGYDIPTEDEEEQWKNGKMELYNMMIEIAIAPKPDTLSYDELKQIGFNE